MKNGTGFAKTWDGLRKIVGRTALGAAYMAGLKAGVYTGLDQLQQLKLVKDTLTPTDIEVNKKWYKGWQRAVNKLTS